MQLQETIGKSYIIEMYMLNASINNNNSTRKKLDIKYLHNIM